MKKIRIIFLLLSGILSGCGGTPRITSLESRYNSVEIQFNKKVSGRYYLAYANNGQIVSSALLRHEATVRFQLPEERENYDHESSCMYLMDSQYTHINPDKYGENYTFTNPVWDKYVLFQTELQALVENTVILPEKPEDLYEYEEAQNMATGLCVIKVFGMNGCCEAAQKIGTQLGLPVFTFLSSPACEQVIADALHEKYDDELVKDIVREARGALTKESEQARPPVFRYDPEWARAFEIVLDRIKIGDFTRCREKVFYRLYEQPYKTWQAECQKTKAHLKDVFNHYSSDDPTIQTTISGFIKGTAEEKQEVFDKLSGIIKQIKPLKNEINNKKMEELPVAFCRKELQAMKHESYMKGLQRKSKKVINKAFHENHKKAWGFVNKALEENRDSAIHKLHVEVRIECLDIGFVCGRFKYPLSHCGGNLIYIGEHNNGFLFKEQPNNGNCRQDCEFWFRSDGKKFQERCGNEVIRSGELKN